MKRPASDLETEVPSSQNDVDMIPVSSSEPAGQTEDTTEPTQAREPSVDMVRNEGEDSAVGEAEVVEAKDSGAPPLRTGMHVIPKSWC